MADLAEVQQLELLCQAFYGGGGKEEQNEAHKVLLPLVNNPENMPRLQAVLAHSSNLQALLFASSGLMNLFTRYWGQISDKQKEETRNFLLNYLYQRSADLLHNAHEILGHLIRLLCRIVKLSWFEDVDKAKLTQEMQPKIGSHMSRLRRVAFSFRDIALPSILKVAVKTLQQFDAGAIRVPNEEEETRLLKQVLQLALNCLSFDFMGTMADDTTDEQNTVMIPQGWSEFREETFPRMFFSLYNACWHKTPHRPRVECARLCLSCLVLISAFRRSFFETTAIRNKYMGELILGTFQIIKTRTGLSDDMCYHEFCRLIGKVNTSHHLSELCASEPFREFPQHLFDFTMESLKSWQRMPNSKHYLLGVWAHMISPLLFYKQRVPKDLELYIERITAAFIMSRMCVAEAIAEDSDNCDWESPLNNEVLRQEQLEVLSQLARCRYTKTARMVHDLFEETKAKAQSGEMNRKVFEEKITWLVYLIGALVGSNWTGRLPDVHVEDASSETVQMANAGLSKLVLTLIEETKCEGTPEALELAFLYFLDQFRKLFIGQFARTLDSPSAFATALGAADDKAIVATLVSKIGFNLQHRVNMPECIKKSMDLLFEFVAGVHIVHWISRAPELIVTGRLLLETPTGAYFLTNHCSAEFKFLSMRRYSRLRTTYYLTLGTLLFYQQQKTTVSFEQFVQPMDAIFLSLWQQTDEGRNPASIRNPLCRDPLIGLVRDLRGLSFASGLSSTYTVLFDWLMSPWKKINGTTRMAIFSWAADAWWDDAEVLVPLLKFIADFVDNRGGNRIHFVESSANGIRLFKEASSVVLKYGNRILQKQDFSDPYKEKYKGMAVALQILSNIIRGSYCHYEVFEVYGDTVLNDSLRLALQMCLAIPQDDLMAYLKSLGAVYSFLEVATESFMQNILELPPAHLAQLLRCVEDGLCAQETVLMLSCATLGNFVEFIFKYRNSEEKEGEAVRAFLEAQPGSLPRMLQLIFQLLMTGQLPNLFSISGVLLGLILLQENEYLKLKQQIIEQQIECKRPQVEGFFTALMLNIEEDLETANKDKFMRNLYHFAHDIRKSTRVHLINSSLLLEWQVERKLDLQG
ncbi:exportin 7, putative [Eimeria necatrix]|uniref:Exportin 7, putative n=1 Tax=Eimeria necatrix TaxID=51315 RepID=U6MQK8_9EIME|nr:exportin 7, putative [Eimeria necatrix]CDJ66296.1 exportin 7, putative [Eimeria necatrix]